MAAPRFDEKSVQRAQPAVPLGRRGRVSSWQLTVAALCVLAGLAGGVVGAYVLSLYQRGGAARVESAEAARAPSAAATETNAPAQPNGAAPANVAAPAPSDAAATRPGEAPKPAAEQAAAVNTTPVAETVARNAVSETAAAGEPVDGRTKEELRGALDGWVAATNARDVGRQMQFYGPTLGAFYLSRNASREAVRAEKARLFSAAAAVDVRAGEPEIRLDRDGRTAVMRFRKRYQIGGPAARSGEVLQELRWRRTPEGWKIVGERDLRVIQ